MLIAVADPDLQMRGWGGGIWEWFTRTSETSGQPGLIFFFSALCASVYSENKEGPGPFPGSTTA